MELEKECLEILLVFYYFLADPCIEIDAKVHDFLSFLSYILHAIYNYICMSGISNIYYDTCRGAGL